MGRNESTIVLRSRDRDHRYEKELLSVGRRYSKSEIEEKLEFLYRISNKDSVMYQGNDELSDLLSRNLIDLYELCLKYDQTEYPRTYENGLYRYATRVFKVYTSYVEPSDLKKIEHVYCNGMFWPLQGAFLSRSIMNDYFEECYKWKTNGKGKKRVMNDDELRELGLPDNLDYLMINRLSNGMGFVLRNDVWENSFIRTRNCFVPLNLNAIG